MERKKRSWQTPLFTVDPALVHLERSGRDWVLHLDKALVHLDREAEDILTDSVELYSDASGVIVLPDGTRINFNRARLRHWEKS